MAAENPSPGSVAANIVLIGGAGSIGRRAAELLVGRPEVASITIADIDPLAAARVADELGANTKAIWTDFSDRGETRDALCDADLIIGCLGARPALELGIVQRVLELRIPYVGICGDWSATEAILELYPDAVESGSLVITGAGASPGLTNLLTAHGARNFDVVNEIHISWVGSINSPSSPDSVVHTLRSFMGRTRVRKEGGWRFVNAGGGRELVWFPEPVGAVEISTCRHPEPIMLARSFPEAREISVKGSIGVSLFLDMLKFASLLGMSRKVLERSGGLPGIDTWLPGASWLGGGPRWSALRVEVRGEHQGQFATEVLGAVDSMQNLVAGPLAAAALLVTRGEVDATGVLTPEEILDPVAVFRQLALWGIKIARLESANGAAA